MGIKILKPFYEHNKKLPKPIMVEEDFGKYNLQFEGCKLRGKWDRADEIDGKIVITDYKTDFFSPAMNTFLLHRLPQFTFYALAWKMKYGNIPHLAMHHLRSGQVFKTRRREDDFEYLRDVIVKTKERILSGDFTPFYGFHDKLCDFQPECRKDSIGLGSKLKRLENALKTEPEIYRKFSYEVPESCVRISDVEKYMRRRDFENAFYSLLEHIKTLNCPLETHHGSLYCMLWDEESPLSLPEPKIGS